MSEPTFSLVVATDRNRGIGVGGKLPWRLREDMRHFRELTTGSDNSVIMGRKTWESIPDKFRPLPGRRNVVMTKNGNYKVPDGVWISASLDGALAVQASNIFVIGGAEVYAEAIDHPGCKDMYLTRVQGEYECDTFFPPCEGLFSFGEVLGAFSENGVDYSIERWVHT